MFITDKYIIKKGSHLFNPKMSFHVDSKENVYLITVVTVLCFWMLENLKMQSYAEFTLTNPIFPTASL